MIDRDASPVRVQVAHTAELDRAVLAAARALLDASFEDMSEQDWDHALGGMHAIAWEGDELVGHGSVVQRRLLYRGRPLRAGYLEGVAVRADRRRRGIGAAMMAELERIVRGSYHLGALGASESGAALYSARGWIHWRGPTWTLGPVGPRRTPGDDGDIYVLVTGLELDVREPLACDWRDGELW